MSVIAKNTNLQHYGLIAPIFCWAYVKEFSKSIVPKIKYQSFILKFSLFFVSILSIRDFTIGLAPIFPPVLAAAPFGIILFAIWLFRDSQQEIHNGRGGSHL